MYLLYTIRCIVYKVVYVDTVCEIQLNQVDTTVCIV
jgi:hypothetical protein